MSNIVSQLKESEDFKRKSVGQLLAENPLRASIFEEYGIDYCCGGKLSLAEACKKKGIDPDSIVSRLNAISKSNSLTEADWTKATLKDLIEHIIDSYHVKLRAQLPRIAELSAKVARVHGETRPEMKELNSIFMSFKSELEMHMQKEELVLFPGIIKMESGEEAFFGCGGKIEHPIGVMTFEHEQAGSALAAMRKICNDYTPPEEACNSYRALFAALDELERDMHWHVHKENNILFPNALRLQEGMQDKQGCSHC